AKSGAKTPAKSAAKRTAKTVAKGVAKSRARTAADTGASSANHVAGIAISNPEKLLYPEAGVSKLELARYYEAAGDRMLEHLRNRPLTLVRCPNGWKHCFYQ